MNFVRFIENRYQELTLENEKHKDAFQVWIDSEIKASHALLNAYRWFAKWVLVPKIFMDYILVQVGLKDEPEPVLMNKLKRDRESKKVADAMRAETMKTQANVTPIKPDGEAPSTA